MLYKKIILLVVLFSLSCAEETDEILSLLQGDLDEYSEIATKTKQNVDYMPYIISVLEHNELEKLGVSNLREALELVPGLDLSIGMAGVKTPIFRGSNPFAMGQSKLIIDGVVVNDKLFGGYNRYLEIPIDIIERIEVVRGSGSLLKHVNSYAGSIHVITKANKDDGTKTKNNVFAAYGSHGYSLGGAVASFSEDDLTISSDLFYQKHNMNSSNVGPDRFNQVLDASLWLRNYSFALNLEYKDFYIKSRVAKSDNGVSYGQAFSLTNDETDFLDVANNFLETGYSFNISSDIKAKVSLGYFDEQRDLKNKTMPDSMMMANGMYFLVDYNEKTYNEHLQLNIFSFENHNITLGALFEQSYVKNNSAGKSKNNLLNVKYSQLLSNQKRDTSSFYIDDLINIGEKTSIQLGLKIDNFNDVENQVSPRLAVVYRYDDENIYKLMYSNSYREPSWREQYLVGAAYPNATSDIRHESVESYEAAYIGKFGTQSDIKLNIFYLENKEQINAENPTNTFKNMGNNEIYGFEAEVNTNFGENDKLYLNYSYVDGGNANGTLANTASSIAKAYYIYDINEALSIATLFKYVGNKDRIDSDTRNKLSAYSTTDLTLMYSNIPNDFKLTFSVKNLFDEIYYLPSPSNTYPNDFKQDGQNFLIKLSKEF